MDKKVRSSRGVTRTRKPRFSSQTGLRSLEYFALVQRIVHFFLLISERYSRVPGTELRATRVRLLVRQYEAGRGGARAGGDRLALLGRYAACEVGGGLRR